MNKQIEEIYDKLPNVIKAYIRHIELQIKQLKEQINKNCETFNLPNPLDNQKAGDEKWMIMN